MYHCFEKHFMRFLKTKDFSGILEGCFSNIVFVKGVAWFSFPSVQSQIPYNIEKWYKQCFVDRLHTERFFKFLNRNTFLGHHVVFKHFFGSWSIFQIRKCFPIFSKASSRAPLKMFCHAVLRNVWVLTALVSIWSVCMICLPSILSRFLYAYIPIWNCTIESRYIGEQSFVFCYVVY